MPSEFLTTYRDRFRAFHEQFNREQFLFHSGQKAQAESKFLHAEFSDLFSASALSELHDECAEIPAYRDHDLAAVQTLLAFATHEHLQAQVRAIDEEIQTYQTQTKINWAGAPINFHDVASMLTHEPLPNKRHDLAARRSDIINGTQDLRAERLALLHTAARTHKAENYLALYQKLHGVAYETLAAQLRQLLTHTESKYVAAFAPLLAREAHVSLDEATHADLRYLRRLANFDEAFPAWRLLHAYRDTFSSLGISTYKQPNIVIDDQVRPHKKSQSAHFPLHVPGEIQIVLTPKNGYQKYEALLHEAGHAQHYAWTSQNLFPELQFSGDYAMREAYAILFGSLVHDEHWLALMPHFDASKNFRHALAVFELLRVRKFAAQLQYEVELHAEKLSDNAAPRYAELLTDAVRVRFDEAEHLRAASDNFYAADFLRASALAAQLREHLKIKFGTRWWAARKAGEFLIDLWNTGGRYHAEELAKLIGLGELSYDWLAEELSGNLRNDK